MIVFYTSVFLQIIASLFYWLKIRRPLSHPVEEEYESPESTVITELLEKSSNSPTARDNPANLSVHSIKTTSARSPRNSNRFLRDSPKQVRPSTLLREIIKQENKGSPK